ncbi:tRNA (guanine10-N2)-methyltransferase [Schistosoma bovis]|uniref:tRNA (Guanine10-N2)-methyltransferase n=1 Tax=Schistosoma bovis TaxID=6184 RepID=A0A430QDP1_SCHBO|nr:tRNA (guanine10-N2)-methyltransferase [Schistosoma bovis]
MQKYVFSFAASEFVNFRWIEFKSLAEIEQLSYSVSESKDDWLRPYIVVEMENDDSVLSIIKRSVLIKSAFHLWCEATTLSELTEQVANLPNELIDPYLNGCGTFKIVLSSAHKKLKQEEKIPIIETILDAHERIDAQVSLSSPDHQINILLEYTPKNLGKNTISSGGHLCRLLYGRLIGSSIRRNMMNDYRLSERAHLGNTTMNVTLAAIMANVGLCRKSSFVWDPFIGTGSTVIAASVWGSFGGGSDIDYSVLHGIGMSPKAGQERRCGETLRSNYEQYKLESRYLDVMVADIVSLHKFLRIPHGGLFDAIITDPPYGFRERSCKVSEQPVERKPTLVTRHRLAEIMGVIHIGLIYLVHIYTQTCRFSLSLSFLVKPYILVHGIVLCLYSDENHNGNKDEVDEESLVLVPHDLPHFPHKVSEPFLHVYFIINKIYKDLLDLAAYLLYPNGRLVFWIPVLRSEFIGVKSLPHHPSFRLLAACEQTLNTRNSRYMVVMVKLDTNQQLNDLSNENEDLIFPAVYAK